MTRLSKRRQDYPHLTDAQFTSLIKRETEPAGTSGGLLVNGSASVYICPNCSHAIFTTSAKFASGTGWPSFYEALGVKERHDLRFFQNGQMIDARKEVVCGNCSAHLGHVFRGENWATPTGVRYCINSSSIVLESKD